MPKVRRRKNERAGGFSIHVLTRDEHPPPHVHVFNGDRPTGPNCRVKLGGSGDVGDPGLEPVFWDVSGPEFSMQEAWEAVELVKRYREECWKVWREKNDHL